MAGVKEEASDAEEASEAQTRRNSTAQRSRSVASTQYDETHLDNLDRPMIHSVVF